MTYLKIHRHLTERNNRYMPVLSPKEPLDKEEFLDRVHKFTGISRSLLAGAMEAFANETRDLLADGWNVEMGNFGFFSTSLQCPPVKDKKRNSGSVCPNEKY